MACLTVEQSGPRRLWAELSAAYDLWRELGCPRRDRIGMSVDPDGTSRLWLDEPGLPLPIGVCPGR